MLLVTSNSAWKCCLAHLKTGSRVCTDTSSQVGGVSDRHSDLTWHQWHADSDKKCNMTTGQLCVWLCCGVCACLRLPGSQSALLFPAANCICAKIIYHCVNDPLSRLRLIDGCCSQRHEWHGERTYSSVLQSGGTLGSRPTVACSGTQCCSGSADLPLPLSCNGKSQGPGWDQQGVPCWCFEVSVIECDMPAFLQKSLGLSNQMTAEWKQHDIGLPDRRQA